jgi:hypothetical protein
MTMKTTLLHTALLAASLFVTANASSDPDIYKCRDAAGFILLTDRPCSAGMTAAPVAVDEPAQAQDQAPAAEADAAFADLNASDTEAAPMAVVIRAPSPGLLLQAKPLRRALAVDIDTLKQAKLALLADDAAWKSHRAMRD